MEHAGTTTESVWLSRLLMLLAVGLAANSILGPFALDIVDYHYTDSLINQGIGLEAVALLGATPVALTAAALVAWRHPAGPVLAFIPSTFAAYVAPQYIIGPDYLGLPGPQRNHRSDRHVRRRSERVHTQRGLAVQADAAEPNQRTHTKPPGPG